MSRKIIFVFTVLFMTSLFGLAWAAGEGRRQIRPLDYQSLRSYTESQQVIPNYVAERYPDNFEDKVRRDAARYVPPKRRFRPAPLRRHLHGPEPHQTSFVSRIIKVIRRPADISRNCEEQRLLSSTNVEERWSGQSWKALSSG